MNDADKKRSVLELDGQFFLTMINVVLAFSLTFLLTIWLSQTTLKNIELKIIYSLGIVYLAFVFILYFKDKLDEKKREILAL